ncbi:hypothetical protein [Streptomyces sp. NPDC002690]
MSEDLRTTEQLKALFAQYPGAADALHRVNQNVARINEINARGGGDGEDEASKQYREAITAGMPPITQTLDLLNVLVDQLGVDGTDAMKIFDRAETEAQQIGAAWTEDS